MTIRFNDVPYHTFSFLSDMIVVCPKCSKAGVVRFDRKKNIALFQCESCYTKKETVPGGNYAFEVTAQCTTTGKYFQISIILCFYFCKGNTVQSLTCPIIRVNGTKPVEENINFILEQI